MKTFYNQEKMSGWIHRYAIDWAAPAELTARAAG
jgi:hypothetical protein